MVEAIVFLGPTISQHEARQIVDAKFMGPAGQGDIYNAYKMFKPDIIGIIDGFFENRPSVWHKEILFVMSKGVHILGGSSMGALRAAELHQFGMQGVGSIFEAFKDARLEDDDEVAIIHGPSELGYPLLSEAMVNIRATFMDAVKGSVIGEETFKTLINAAKQTYYKERSYTRIFHEAGGREVLKKDIVALKLWVDENRRDVKKEDAVKLLEQIAIMKSQDVASKKVEYNFENTIFWENAFYDA